MSPTKAIAIATFLNIITVIGMERVKHLWKDTPPAFTAEPWLWYAVVAATIAVTQFFIIAASLNDGFPLYAAIGILIAFVLAAATLNGCRTAGRWPTLLEIAGLLALITAAFTLQIVGAKAERDHLQRQHAASQNKTV